MRYIPYKTYSVSYTALTSIQTGTATITRGSFRCRRCRMSSTYTHVIIYIYIYICIIWNVRTFCYLLYDVLCSAYTLWTTKPVTILRWPPTLNALHIISSLVDCCGFANRWWTTANNHQSMCEESVGKLTTMTSTLCGRSESICLNLIFLVWIWMCKMPSNYSSRSLFVIEYIWRMEGKTIIIMSNNWSILIAKIYVFM